MKNHQKKIIKIKNTKIRKKVSVKFKRKENQILN